MKHKAILSFALIICMFSLSFNSYAEQVNWHGDDVKTLVDIYNGIDVNSPKEWEMFEDEYVTSGGRASFFFHNSELSDFQSSNKLIKITYKQVGKPTEKNKEYYEQMKTDFGFYFMTDDYKEYYYGFNITERTVFSIKDAIKGSGVSPNHIAVAILLGNPYNEPFEVNAVDIIDCVKGWNSIDGKKYYVKKDGTMSVGLSKIKGSMYYFGKDGKCVGKYTGFAKNSKGKMYYKKGILVKNSTFEVKGKQYRSDKNGYCRAL